MQFPPFEHAAWLARAWRDGAPRHNLGSSGFHNPAIGALLAGVEVDDLEHIDLDAGLDLAAKIAARHGLALDRVLVTHGTSGANTTVLVSLLEPGCNVVALRPTYMPLPALAEGLGAAVRWADGIEAALEQMDRHTAAIVLTSPNNPTGTPVPEVDLLRLAEAAARHGAYVVVDQVYRELTDHALGATLHPAIISTSGMNKCWGAAGLRIGWIVAAPPVLDRLRNTARVLHLAPATFGMRMAAHLLDHEAACRRALDKHLAAAHAVYRRHALPDWPEPVGLTAAVPVANSQAVAEALLEQGILTVPGELFGAPGLLRIGFGVAPDELDAALTAFVAALRAQTF